MADQYISHDPILILKKVSVCEYIEWIYLRQSCQGARLHRGCLWGDKEEFDGFCLFIFFSDFCFSIPFSSCNEEK